MAPILTSVTPMVVTSTGSSCSGGRVLHAAAISFFAHMYTMKAMASTPTAMCHGSRFFSFMGTSFYPRFPAKKLRINSPHSSAITPDCHLVCPHRAGSPGRSYTLPQQPCFSSAAP